MHPSLSHTRSCRPLHVLWVTTKSPWPAHDGGRLLMDGTLRALDPEQVRVTLVFPVDENSGGAIPKAATARPACLDEIHAVPVQRRKLVSVVRPATAQRHRLSAVRSAVERRLLEGDVDVIHVEQPHALENIPDSTPPILLRTQNVEQDLWRQMATTLSPPRRWAMRFEADRVARWERSALRRADKIITISMEDRERMLHLDSDLHSTALDVVHPAVPEVQETGPRLEGDPALTLFASSSWGPNRDGARFFLERSWPAIRAARTSCRLHVFGGPSAVSELPGVRHHPAPFATASAFAEGAIVVVPVRAASGVRMKILDAWSRGLAAVTTRTGATGLGPTGGEILRPVGDIEELHHAVLRIADGSGAEKQVARGRAWLRAHANPPLVGSAFLSHYQVLANVRR